MSYTVEQLNAIKAAYADGARDVWIGNRRLTYATTEDMERIIATIERSLGVGGTEKRRMQWVSRKGL